MYILFINLVTCVIYFFLLNLIIIIIIKIVQPKGSTRPMWVGLGWVEFFFTHHGGLSQKIPLTRPMHTPSFNVFIKTIFKICDDGSPYSLKPSFSTHSLQIYCLGLVGLVHNQFEPQTETPHIYIWRNIYT